MTRLLRPHVIYRAYDAGDHLLYVGMSGQPMGRLEQHRRAGWFQDVSRVTFEHVATRAEAIEREARAIGLERPLHNRFHLHHQHAADRADEWPPRDEPEVPRASAAVAALEAARGHLDFVTGPIAENFRRRLDEMAAALARVTDRSEPPTGIQCPWPDALSRAAAEPVCDRCGQPIQPGQSYRLADGRSKWTGIGHIACPTPRAVEHAERMGRAA